MKISIKDIAYNGIIAALYVVLTLVTYQFSYGPIQFRIAEIMVLLCFFRKDYVVGLTIGCLLANLFSSVSYFDILFGTVATLIACLLVCYSKILLVSILYPIVVNGLIVGLMLFLFVPSPASFWFYAGTVALGELAVMIVGYVLLMILRKQETFLKLIRANQNLAFKL
ncbi:MAG TPA: QueT transporter family protein [Bacilli bacterium]|nr:QueT transporter family protein [Bacilli bacterium]HPS19146.1 QueT transporter family protein [Bacilli bacterium]